MWRHRIIKGSLARFLIHFCLQQDSPGGGCAEVWRERRGEPKRSMANEFLQNIQLDETLYVDLLTKLIGESERLQNNPHMGMLAQEDLAAQHVMDLLKPLSQEEGGPLKIEHLTYVEGRGNLTITYPGSTDKTCGFVGSHLDVVCPPRPKRGWKITHIPPFEPITTIQKSPEKFRRKRLSQ
jgi:hypothetical protein